MPAFKIPNQPPTINKTVRFPTDVIEAVESYLKGSNSTFSSFVIAATLLPSVRCGNGSFFDVL